MQTKILLTILILLMIDTSVSNAQSVFLCYICTNCPTPFNGSTIGIISVNCSSYCQVLNS